MTTHTHTHTVRKWCKNGGRKEKVNEEKGQRLNEEREGQGGKGSERGVGGEVRRSPREGMDRGSEWSSEPSEAW